MAAFGIHPDQSPQQQIPLVGAFLVEHLDDLRFCLEFVNAVLRGGDVPEPPEEAIAVLRLALVQVYNCSRLAKQAMSGPQVFIESKFNSPIDIPGELGSHG
jgi:hypothetical protein